MLIRTSEYVSQSGKGYHDVAIFSYFFSHAKTCVSRASANCGNFHLAYHLEHEKLILGHLRRVSGFAVFHCKLVAETFLPDFKSAKFSKFRNFSQIIAL